MASGPAADAAGGIELDRINVAFPLPYRVAIIITIGIWAWGLNLYYLSALRIDVPALIKYTPRTSTGSPHYQRIFRLASTASAFLVTSILLFWLITRGDSESVRGWQILPQSYLIFLIALFVLPLQRLSKNGRYRFLSTLKRVSVGGIAETQDGKFGDILLADALTSYAKVLGDLFISTCMVVKSVLGSGLTSTDRPERTCGGRFMVPLVIAIPSMIRLRQCLIEYRRTRRNPTVSSGWGGQHLANALKYSSAFPVIILSAMQRGRMAEKKPDEAVSGATLYHMWIAAVIVNSLYSFYWDVAKDWDLNLFSGSEKRNDLEYPYGLRRRLHFKPFGIYYVVIALDFVLRCTWSLKLSMHLDHFNDWEGSIFMMEFLEVFRRWVWIFFRVETEWVRTHAGPGPDDILLGEYQRDDSDKLDID